MNITNTILIRSFVKPFYRQNGGFFTFLFIILFGAVGRVDGAGLFEYHFSLIRGILKNPFVFLLILFLWLLYAKKCEQFILNILRRPDYAFLQILSGVKTKKLYVSLVIVQVLLFLPVIIYAMIIGVAGIYLHVYIACGILLLYLISLCLISVRWYLYHIQNPALSEETQTGRYNLTSVETSYWSIFIRYIGGNKKMLFAGIKIFSCGILYGMLVNQTGTNHELDMIILFFSLGILGHGLLIHQIRDLEETRLSFYRSIPVSIFKRFVQYAVFYLIILLPEIFTIIVLTPKHLGYSDAVLFVFSGYSLLLFMHSLLFIQFFPMKAYLKIIMCLYLTIYCSILVSSLLWLCLFLFSSSFAIFRARYYRYERQLVS
jgi:hypothetical protein